MKETKDMLRDRIAELEEEIAGLKDEASQYDMISRDGVLAKLSDAHTCPTCPPVGQYVAVNPFDCVACAAIAELA